MKDKAKDRLVIFVEDSRMTRRVVGEMLESLGFEVIECASIDEAQRWVRETKRTPSLALIDWGLPDGTGLELVRAWRQNPRMRDTQLLMLTIRSEREVIEAALEAGADEFLMKPCTIEALEDKLALLEFPRLPEGGERRALEPAGRRSRRVLIVDDSSIARRAIKMALASHPGVELIGHATDGRAGLEQILREDPDVVILDIEMPGFTGLDVLRELRSRSPHTAVLVFSTHTARGASITVEALLLGARDCLLKPEKMDSFEASLSWIREQLGARIEAITARPSARAPRVLTPASAGAEAVTVTRSADGPPPELIVLASSTGGPLALRELLGGLPADLPVPIVAVQHLPADFIEPFVKQLGRSVAIPVEVARYDAPVVPGRVYFAPSGAHLSLCRVAGELRFAREDGPRLGGCRPAADVLFGAAAEHVGARCLAVVLTGMGSDGCEGARRLVAAGGRVYAQDQASSAVWSMPGAVVRSGLASQIVPLETMSAAILAGLE